MSFKPKMPRVQSENHLRFLRGLQCVVCGNATSVEAAHIRYSDVSVGRMNPGTHKSSDWWAVPLCSFCHRIGSQSQHNHKRGPDSPCKHAEADYWRLKGIDVSKVAMALALHSGNQEVCISILTHARNR